MTAIGYTRLSEASDLSIERQKRHIRGYCEANDLDLEEIYDDGQFSSGFNVERSEYQNIKQRIRDGLDAIVVHHKDRIGRDFDERMRFVLLLREHDVELHSTMRGHIDLSDPTDAAVESVHAAKDDEVKRDEIEKSKQATRERLENGYDHGRPPFGLEFDEAGEYLVPSDGFESAVEVLELRRQGLSFGEIADRMEFEHGEKARRIWNRRDKYERYC